MTSKTYTTRCPSFLSGCRCTHKAVSAFWLCLPPLCARLRHTHHHPCFFLPAPFFLWWSCFIQDTHTHTHIDRYHHQHRSPLSNLFLHTYIHTGPLFEGRLARHLPEGRADGFGLRSECTNRFFTSKLQLLHQARHTHIHTHIPTPSQ